MSRTIDVALRIDADEYLRLYRGEAQDVVCTAQDGRTVRFPAKILQPYVTRAGVEGYFRINFSAEGKFENVTKLG